MTFEQMKAQRTSRDALEQALSAAGATIKGKAVKCPFHEDNHQKKKHPNTRKGHQRQTTKTSRGSTRHH